MNSLLQTEWNLFTITTVVVMLVIFFFGPYLLRNHPQHSPQDDE